MPMEDDHNGSPTLVHVYAIQFASGEKQPLRE